MAQKTTIPDDFSAPAMEQATLARWAKQRTFQRSLDKNPRRRRFTFYDGPPFATGLPHYGHFLQSTIKDVIPRFKTMQGYRVERRWGWDCHGLPVEYELEKERGIKSRQQILELGVNVFNEACRAIVLRHTTEWQAIISRLGRWVDFKHDYKTMDPDYMESIWWVVKSLWEKKLLYEGKKSMHICPRCATPLSNFEVTQAYRDRQDPAVYATFPLADDPQTALVAWTTTPWTLPGNVLLAVNPDLTYVEVADPRAGSPKATLIVAESRLAAAFENNPPKVLRTLKATDLVGRTYEAPFPITGLRGKHYEVVADQSVTADEGTGLLHVAPAFGEDDMRIGEREKAAFVQHLTITGNLTEPFDRYHDLTALEANQPLAAELKQAGRLLRQETITHSYPHCWRCDTPLLNYAMTTWFVAVSKLKPRLLAENQRIKWTPEHVRDGRFGKWLAGARDWAISRNRFWGNPLPIWRCAKNHIRVVGSRDELKQLSGIRPSDLHKHFVDKIIFPCPDCDGEMTRVEDVLDCWFESGSMPYAERHYPFENKPKLAAEFPADFVAEGIDQTRGWFYTLHVLGVALRDSRAFNNVVTTGMILAEDGRKMSKRLKNYPDPEQIIATYGADALRLYMISSPIVRGDDLRLAERGVAEVMRNFTLTLWNSYSFWSTYADSSRPTRAPRPSHLLDRWILSRLSSLTETVTAALEDCDLMSAARDLSEFVEELSNWHLRRSRRRFRATASRRDRAAAAATLHYALTTFCRLAAPFTPFITDHLYRGLTGQPSVHLADWPKPADRYRDRALEDWMALARQIVRLGLAARSQAGTRVRQPLREVRVMARAVHGLARQPAIIAIIAEELNVKRVVFTKAGDDFARQVAIPDPKVIGPAVGPDAQRVIASIKAGDFRRTKAGFTVGRHRLPAAAIELAYHPGDHFAVESAAGLVVGLDTDLDRALRDEGLAREVIRQVQEFRKVCKLAVADRIRLTVSAAQPRLNSAIVTHRELIASETLASSLEVGEVAGQNKQTVRVGGIPLAIGLAKSRPKSR